RGVAGGRGGPGRGGRAFAGGDRGRVRGRDAVPAGRGPGGGGPQACAGHGGMLSVSAPAAQVEQELPAWAGKLSVAVVNSPVATVVSGDLAALDELAGGCGERGWRTRPVPIGYASHSAQVEPVEHELTAALAQIKPVPGQLAMVSGMTGGLVDGPELEI